MGDYLRHRYKDKIQIDEASDGAQAIAKIVQQHYSLMITDIKMPRMSGTQLMDALESIPSAQRPKYVVIVSGHEVMATDKTAKNVMFMEKPLELATFGRFVESAVQDLSQQEITPELVEPFIAGTLTVMEKLCARPAKKLETVVRKDGQVSGDISGVIQLAGPTVEGSMSISFERSAFLGAVCSMFGEEVKAIDESSMDAAGEISNQIYGFAKTELNKRGFAFGMSLPTVVTGEGHSLKHTVPGLCFSTRFQTQDGYFSVEVVLRPTEKIDRNKKASHS